MRIPSSSSLDFRFEGVERIYPHVSVSVSVFVHLSMDPCAYRLLPVVRRPQDAEVANMYKLNRETYNQTARFWTETYAQVRALCKSHAVNDEGSA